MSDWEQFLVKQREQNPPAINNHSEDWNALITNIWNYIHSRHGYFKVDTQIYSFFISACIQDCMSTKVPWDLN